MATLFLYTLMCQATQDSTGEDEAYINFNGQRVFGPTNINDAQSREIGVFRRFEGQATVDLFDEDSPDADDFLGNLIVSQGEAGQGVKIATFTGSGAHYTMSYEVKS